MPTKMCFISDTTIVNICVSYYCCITFPCSGQQRMVSMMQDHLDAAFSPSSPPLVWDTEQEYTRERVELYYLTNAATPLSLDKLTEVM